MKTVLNFLMISFLILIFYQSVDAQWLTNGNNLPNGNKFLGTLSTSTFKDVIVKTNGIEALRVLGSNHSLVSAPMLPLQNWK